MFSKLVKHPTSALMRLEEETVIACSAPKHNPAEEKKIFDS